MAHGIINVSVPDRMHRTRSFGLSPSRSRSPDAVQHILNGTLANEQLRFGHHREMQPGDVSELWNLPDDRFAARQRLTAKELLEYLDREILELIGPLLVDLFFDLARSASVDQRGDESRT